MSGNDERRYGFFRCTSCKRGWESSWAWCYRGTDKPSSGQECQSCKIMVKPYKVEKLKCSLCGLTTDLCDCDREERHVDPKKPHRSDLCERCQSGRPCDSSGRF